MTNNWNPWKSDDSRLKDHHYYLVTHTEFGTPMKAKYHQEIDAFEIINNPTTCAYKWDNKVLAWQELPEVYRESEGEQ